MLRLASSGLARSIAQRGVALQARRGLVTKFSKVRAAANAILAAGRRSQEI